MKVSLIDYTGVCSPDPLYAAKLLVYTKSTRLTQGLESRKKVFAMSAEDVAFELDYIAKTIRSSWEFVDYTFEIAEVSRAFTHQFVRTRTGSFAQQSQRSVDVTGFEYVTGPSIEQDSAMNSAYEDVMEYISEVYKDLISSGAQVEDARGILPTNIHTSIIAKFNLRTLADMAPKRNNPRAQGEYTQVFKLMIDELLKVHPWAREFIFPDRLQTPSLDSIIQIALAGRTPLSAPEVNAALKELDALKSTWG